MPPDTCARHLHAGSTSATVADWISASGERLNMRIRVGSYALWLTLKVS
jgi:hypothetical protein